MSVDNLIKLESYDIDDSINIDESFTARKKFGLTSIIEDPRYQELINDKKMWVGLSGANNILRGIYKGIPWRMRRPYGTYICAYVTGHYELSDEILEKLESVAHGGLTSGLGFDTAHYQDWTGMFQSLSDNTVYRDTAYCLNVIREMIDIIVRNDKLLPKC